MSGWRRFVDDRVTCPRCHTPTHVDEMLYLDSIAGWLCASCIEDRRRAERGT